MKSALSSNDVEIRDAALQASESWDGTEIRKIFLDHNEPAKWLRDYAEVVADELGTVE